MLEGVGTADSCRSMNPGDESLMSEERVLVSRKRVRLQLTVNPKTDMRLGILADKFTTNKGRLVDKLVEVLAASYSSGKQHCVSGRPCKIDLTDLPDVY